MNSNQGQSFDDARNRSYKQKSQCEAEFKKVFGGAKSVSKSDYTKYHNNYWTVQEFFITDK